MEWLLYTAIALVAFGVGNHIGHRNEASIWRIHAGPTHRSAICSDSTFYYVVPEHEYVELELDHVYLTHLRADCDIE